MGIQPALLSSATSSLTASTVSAVGGPGSSMNVHTDRECANGVRCGVPGGAAIARNLDFR